MTSRSNLFRGIPLLFWVLAVTAITVWVFIPGYVVGWDLNVYKNAAVALRAGHDPYLEGMAVQRIFHATLAQHPTDSPPYTYVYSPLTLPLLRWIASVPFWMTAVVYWTLYVAGVCAALWFGWQAVEEKERRVFALLLPAAVFLPGLLENDVLFSGNVAIFLYGAVFASAMVGWRRGRWIWFYAAVLLASCCKAPMLSLLAVPVLSARRQWLQALATGIAGVALFAVQPTIWPVAFRHYLEAVELQFSFNHDFSSSPAGLLAEELYYKVPYQTTSAVSYILYAALFAGIMLYLRKQYLDGRFSLKQWAPVMMAGVVLLNPRIMEYDVAPITFLMALVVWRFFAAWNTFKGTILCCALLFTLINVLALIDWRMTESCTLVGVFLVGSWTLHGQASSAVLNAGEAIDRHGPQHLPLEVLAR